jgi:hypothetical protein
MLSRRYCAKIRHATEDGAYCHRRRVKRLNRRRGLAVPGKSLIVYYCPDCSAWHCGHKPEELKPNPA